MKLCNLPRFRLIASRALGNSNPIARWLRLVGYKIAACLCSLFFDVGILKERSCALKKRWFKDRLTLRTDSGFAARMRSVSLRSAKEPFPVC